MAPARAVVKNRRGCDRSKQRGRRTAMERMSRRSVIRGSLSLAAAARLSRPHIADAAAGTAVVWRDQGFVPEEDNAFRATVAEYEKVSGNRIDLSIMPFMALNQKVVSALTSGEVPDLIFHIAPS